MNNFVSQNNQYKKVSFICIGCGNRRSVIVDTNLHLDREELKINGLAPYIDVHEDIKSEENSEHGVKLFVDSHFHVRSNDLLANNDNKVKTLNIPGLPSPSVTIESKKLLYKSPSWNSLELSSRQHNIGFFVVNTDPTTNSSDNPITTIRSPLETISANINFKKSQLSEEQLVNNKMWIKVLLEWIESTPSLNVKLIPSVLKYIDKQNERSPDVVDQLAIPILIDLSAKIKLIDEKKIFEKLIDTSFQQSMNRAIFIPKENIDYETMFLISDLIDKKGYVSMRYIVKNLLKESSTPQQSLDTFVLFFFDLVENDAVEFMVSYLL